MWFPAIAEMQTVWVVCGLIWSVALGFAAGNYACSLVHRLPRGRGVLEKKPYCGNCGTMLATKDLFPVVSALLLRHKCRYCSAPIPKSHFWTEILIGLLFAFCFTQFGFSELYILVAFLGTFFVILASIQTNEGTLQPQIIAATVAIGMVYRVLLDGSIYDFLEGGFFAGIVGVLLWFRQVQHVGHRYTMPDGAKLCAIGGLCVGVKSLAPFFGLFLLFYVAGSILTGLRKQKSYGLSIPLGFAVMALVLFEPLQTVQSIKALIQ